MRTSASLCRLSSGHTSLCAEWLVGILADKGSFGSGVRDGMVVSSDMCNVQNVSVYLDAILGYSLCSDPLRGGRLVNRADVLGDQTPDA